MPNKKTKGLNFEIIGSNLSERGGAAGGSTPCLPSSQFRLEHQECAHRAIREADAKTI